MGRPEIFNCLDLGGPGGIQKPFQKVSLKVKMSHVTDREDTRPGFFEIGFGYGLEKFGPEDLFKRYLSLISEVPEIGFI